MEGLKMKFGKTILFIGIGLCFSLLFSEDYTPQQKEELGQKALHEMLQKIFSESMKAKRAFLENQTREDAISNRFLSSPIKAKFSGKPISSAPRRDASSICSSEIARLASILEVLVI